MGLSSSQPLEITIKMLKYFCLHICSYLHFVLDLQNSHAQMNRALIQASVSTVQLAYGEWDLYSMCCGPVLLSCYQHIYIKDTGQCMKYLKFTRVIKILVRPLCFLIFFIYLFLFSAFTYAIQYLTIIVLKHDMQLSCVLYYIFNSLLQTYYALGHENKLQYWLSLKESPFSVFTSAPAVNSILDNGLLCSHLFRCFLF